jgi:predicted nucleotidyltransferase
MLADPILNRVAELLHKHKLDAVLIGNAAAALQGAPVTTLDLDFMFRKTARNLQKLKKFAHDLDAVILRPYFPVSDLYRVSRDGSGLQIDFMVRVDGIRSYEALRSRSTAATFAGCEIRVASLEDVIHSKTSANRPQDRAVLPLLRRVVRERRR